VTMWSELRNFFWLQWKLTRAMFRGRRTGSRLRILGLILQLISFAFTFPMFLAMGIALAVVMILVSPGAAYEIATLANTLLFFIWLLLPASYSSQIIERFEMTQLFPHPIRFGSIVMGSTLMSFLTITGLWTVPIILGEIVGLAWHQLSALPLIVLGAMPAFTLLVLTGRIMEDFFDLVSGDRRLRAMTLALLSLPFMFCWIGQYAFQYAVEDINRLPGFIQEPLQETIERLDLEEEPESFHEVTAIFSQILEAVRPSRFLIWLPPGWAAAGMGLAVGDHWLRALPYLALSLGFTGLLLWVHAGITRRLMSGAALTAGTERVRSRGQFQHLPGPPDLWTLFHKDWLYLWRSPIPRRLLFSSLIVVAAMILPLRNISVKEEEPAFLRDVAPLAAGGFLITMLNMTISLGFNANYFGVIDREGLVSILHTPVDRRHILLSSNLTTLIYTGAQLLVITLGLALLTGRWALFPLGLCLGLCLQISGAPAYNLAAILAPYRAQLKHGGGRQRGNLWGMAAWALSTPPILALIVLPYLLWKPALIVTLPLAFVYSVGLYTLTLTPLARLLQRREFDTWQAVIAEE